MSSISDEDVLGADLRRTSPLFKPAWSPELLAGFNYFGRLTAMRRRPCPGARLVLDDPGLGE